MAATPTPASSCPRISLLFFLAAATTIFNTAYAREITSNGSCVAAERAALLSFKTGITSDPAGLLGSWHGHDCCRWSGVSCDNRTGHVVELHLRNNYISDDNRLFWCVPEGEPDGLRGKISPSLLSLQHLRHLDLSGANLGGLGVPIPKFLGSVTTLTYLNLGCMNFDGRVPPQLGNLSRLRHLNLAAPFSTQTLLRSDDLSWLSRLRMLRSLDMSGVNLSSSAGDWVRVITLLPSLGDLRLSQCGLRLRHEQITNTSSLQVLYLDSNQIDTLNPEYWFWDVSTIKELDLSRNQIAGRIPDAVGNMTALETLALGGNYLSGVKSQLFSKLCNLRVLGLWSNEVQQDMAEFVDGFSGCANSKLMSLDLSFTNLTGSIPRSIKHWTNLTQLALSDNMLVGTIPLEVGQLTNLQMLILQANMLSGSISEQHFARLSQLTYVDLSQNSLHIMISSDWVPSFSLGVARFAANKMGPHFPSWLKGQKDVYDLDISGASIADYLPEWFWTVFSDAKYLDISSNQLSGRLPATLEFMASAQMLDLGSNNLSGLLPKLPESLSVLDISNNSLSGPLPRDFGAPMLQKLVLFANRINGYIPTYICQLQYLEVLDLSENLLIGQLPQCSTQRINTTVERPGYTQLSALFLHNNSLSGNFPKFLQQTPQLTLLDLSHNKFDGGLPTWIARKLPYLTYLLLRYNMFSGSIPLELTQLAEVQILDLANNKMSGTIPRDLGRLKAMTLLSRTGSDNPLESQSTRLTLHSDRGRLIKYDNGLQMMMKGQELYYTSAMVYMVYLDFSYNNFVGDIPDEIASLIGLVNLNISHNNFTGKIPDKIGLLRALESLDLSFNELSGEIPGSLSGITTLSHLNLSYNNLSGRIPSGNQLQALYDPESIYVGNKYLCGPPLSRKCWVPEVTEVHNEGKSPMDIYFYIGLSLGFVMGLSMVFVTFIFFKVWRVAYFEFLDKMQDNMLLYVAMISAKGWCLQRTVVTHK